jgi:tRNA nucleotidyltransferase (CCA-adding enzyme)
MFLHDIGKPVVRRMDENGRDHFKGHGPVGEEMARTILRRLKYDNDTIASVSRLVKWHDARPNPDMRSVRRAVNRIGDDLFPLYLKVRRADILAQSTYRREEKLKLLDETEACYQEICRENQCTSLKMLAVNGRDLIALGYPTGKQIGAMLNLLLEHVLDHPQDNERGCLLELLPQLLENSKISDN